MSRKKSWLAVSVLLMAVMLLSACQPAAAPTPEVIYQTQIVEKEGQQVTVVVTAQPNEPAAPVDQTPQKKVLHLAWGPSDIPTIDSALAWDVISIQMIDEMTVGLTRQNEQTAELENAMATDVQVADDGLTYTFKIKQGVPWVKYDSVNDQVVQVLDCDGNPRMVNANDFEYGMKRTADPMVAADYAYVLGLAVQGVDEFNSGAAEDSSVVGVTALDDSTLEVKFLRPAVYNLNIMSMWFAHAMPSWLIDGSDCSDARGDKWIETGLYQGYGPFTLKEWVHDAEITLIKNPFWPGDDVVPTAKIDEIHWSIIDTPAALAEFEAGNLDSAGIPSSDQDRILADPQYADMVTYTYTLGTEFYAYNAQLPPTDDVRVRQALSMSIDRQSLINNVIKDGIPSPFFTNPGAAGAPKPELYPDLGINYDPEQAKALMNEYLTEKGQSAADVTISLMFNTGDANKKIAETVQAMWQDNLGIKVELVNQEWAVFKVSRKDGQNNVYRGSWVQDYPDANNFLYEVFAPGGAYQDVVDWAYDPSKTDTWDNPKYDEFIKLLEDAAVETDPDARMELYAQAEQILVYDEAAVMPLRWYSSRILRLPRVQDTQSITGYDRYEKWDISE